MATDTNIYPAPEEPFRLDADKSEPACRRCSDCVGMSHHWMSNGDFGNDDEEAESPTGNSHICKHCPAVGDECPDCEGIGRLDDGDDEDDEGQVCSTCKGEGVILAKPRTFAQWEARRSDDDEDFDAEDMMAIDVAAIVARDVRRRLKLPSIGPDALESEADRVLDHIAAIERGVRQIVPTLSSGNRGAEIGKSIAKVLFDLLSLAGEYEAFVGPQLAEIVNAHKTRADEMEAAEKWPNHAPPPGEQPTAASPARPAPQDIDEDDLAAAHLMAMSERLKEATGDLEVANAEIARLRSVLDGDIKAIKFTVDNLGKVRMDAGYPRFWQLMYLTMLVESAIPEGADNFVTMDFKPLLGSRPITVTIQFKDGVSPSEKLKEMSNALADILAEADRRDLNWLESVQRARKVTLTSGS